MGVMFVVYFIALALVEMGYERTFGRMIAFIRPRTIDGDESGAIISAAPSLANGLNDGPAEGAKYFDRMLSRSDIESRTQSRMATSTMDALLVQELKKKFNLFTAVDGLSFGVHRKECFGLLGVNGAGKTTTFRMLTGDLPPSSGIAHAGPFNNRQSLSGFQQQLGYCPQFDPLLDKLTAREMLFLFGRLRGIEECNLKYCSQELIEMADLRKHADRPTETYSGGNKRKLSLALAMMGSPSLLLLDEPTSGVDPGARRKIWTTLAKVRQDLGCSIILTSHSMEECEALCSRVAIMVNGQFKCIGPIQHLRGKYGQGYTVIIKLKRDNSTRAAIRWPSRHVR